MQNFWNIREKIKNSNESCQTGTEDDYSHSNNTSRQEIPSELSNSNLKTSPSTRSLRNVQVPLETLKLKKIPPKNTPNPKNLENLQNLKDFSDFDPKPSLPNTPQVPQFGSEANQPVADREIFLTSPKTKIENLQISQMKIDSQEAKTESTKIFNLELKNLKNQNENSETKIQKSENVFQESVQSSKSVRENEESLNMSHKNKKKISFTDSFAEQGIGGDRVHKPSQTEEGLMEALENPPRMNSEKKITMEGETKVIKIGREVFSHKNDGKVRKFLLILSYQRLNFVYKNFKS